MRLGPARRRDHLGLGGAGAAIGDIVPRRAIEHRGFLGDHGNGAAQAFLGHRGNVLTVDQDAPGLDVVKPQERRDQGGLAGAGRPDDAQLLARRDGQVDVGNAARLAAIAKAHPLETHLAARHHQRRRAVCIGQAMGRGQGLDAVLDLAQMAVDLHQGKADPAGHLRQPDRDGAGGHDIAGAGLTQRPQPGGAKDQRGRQHPCQRHQGKAEPGRKRAPVPGLFARMFNGLMRGRVLVRVMGEQLDRLDVGHGIDQLAGDQGAGIGPGTRPPPRPRQEPAQQREIARQPDQHRQRDCPVDRHYQQQRKQQ